MISLLLRADASRDVGSGHLMRVIALAEQHRADGGQPLLVLGRGSEQLVDLVAARGVDAVVIDPPVGSIADARQIVSLSARTGCDVCVVDGYRFSSTYVQAIQRGGVRVVAIDDLDRDLGADLVVRPTPERIADGATGELRGSRYALLRQEFLARPRGARPEPQPRFRLLVSFGGTDPTRSAALVLRCLPTERPLAVTVAVGAGYRDDGALRRAADAAVDQGHAIDLAVNIADMSELMVRADAAVCAAGTVLLELAYFACPTLAFVVADNQIPGARSLVGDGSVFSGAQIHGLTESRIRTLVSTLIGDEALRHRLSSRFGTLVDGNGARRVLDAISTLCQENAA